MAIRGDGRFKGQHDSRSGRLGKWQGFDLIGSLTGGSAHNRVHWGGPYAGILSLFQFADTEASINRTGLFDLRTDAEDGLAIGVEAKVRLMDERDSGVSLGTAFGVWAATLIENDEEENVAERTAGIAGVNLIEDSAARVLTGEHTSVAALAQIGENVDAAYSSFFLCDDSPGGEQVNFFLDIFHLTAGDDLAYSKRTGTYTTIDSQLTVRTPDGLRYINLYART